MPVWAVGILEWVIGMALKRLKPEDVKREFASLITTIDTFVMSQEAKVKGPLEGVADEVAEAFHACCTTVVAALKD